MIDRSPDFENLGKICFVIKDNPAKIEIKGTGFFISTSGIALTAWHVIKGLNQQAIPIRFEKRSSQDERPQAIITQASVKCYSEKYDLAVISVKDIMLTDGDIIPITSDFLPGDEVLVTGYARTGLYVGSQFV